MIEGRANLLKQRGEGGGRNAEGALYALLVFDGLAETFQMNVDINYSLEDVITVGGGMEAFFDFKDNTKWYIYIGKKEPEAKRIRAEVISIISASAYFMIDPSAIQFGAAAGINLDLEYGPLVIRLIIRIRFEIALFFKEPQLTGLVELYIELTIKIFGIGLGLIIQALLEGSAPQPWWIHGLARFALSLPFPLPSVDVQVEFTWGQSGEPARVDLLKGAAMIHPKQIGASWELATSENDAPLVPVDAIAILRCGKPLSMVSTEPAQDGGIKWFTFETVEGWEFGYDIKSIALCDGSGRCESYPATFEDEPPTFEDGEGPTSRQAPWLKHGGIHQLPVTQNSEGEQSVQGIQEPQIKLWGYSPLDTLHPAAREQYVNPCRNNQQVVHKRCVHWRDAAAGTAYPAVFSHKGLAFMTELGTPNARVAEDPWPEHGLEVESLVIRFPEPVVFVEIGYLGRANLHAYYQGNLVPEPGKFEDAVWKLDGSNVDSISLKRPQRGSLQYREPFHVVTICYVTKRDQDRLWRGTQDAGAADEAPMVDMLLLKPNTQYRLDVKAQRRERRIGEVSWAPTAVQEVSYYFKTADAPGLNSASDEIQRLPQESDRAQAAKVDFRDGPLNRLETYVERTVPENGAKLFYRGYRAIVEFNEPYVGNMYGGELRLRVKDRNGKVLAGPGGTPIGHKWLKSGLPFITPGLLTLLAAPSQTGCADQHPDRGDLEGRYLTCALPETVQPGRMYTVEVTSSERVLYSFQFATSRYRDIVEHLESGLPRDENGNVSSRDQLVRYGLPNSTLQPETNLARRLH